MVDIRLILVIGVILSAIVGWKWWDYASTVSKQEQEIIALKEDKVTLRTDIQTEKNNVALLRKTLDETNKEIASLETKYQKTQKEYNDFLYNQKNWYQDPQWNTLMSSNLWNSKVCEEGLKLNKMISELKYDTL